MMSENLANRKKPYVKKVDEAESAFFEFYENPIIEENPGVVVTEDMVERAGKVLYVNWDEWDYVDAQAKGERALVRAAIESALGN